jgi:hypothetical protein
MGSGAKILMMMCLMFVLSILLITSGIAYAGGMRGGSIFETCLLFILGVTLVLAQAIPASILLASLTGGVFSSRKNPRIPILTF